MIIKVENKPSLTKKIWLLQSRNTEILRLTQDFGQPVSLLVSQSVSLSVSQSVS